MVRVPNPNISLTRFAILYLHIYMNQQGFLFVLNRAAAAARPSMFTMQELQRIRFETSKQTNKQKKEEKGGIRVLDREIYIYLWWNTTRRKKQKQTLSKQNKNRFLVEYKPRWTLPIFVPMLKTHSSEHRIRRRRARVADESFALSGGLYARPPFCRRLEGHSMRMHYIAILPPINNKIK